MSKRKTTEQFIKESIKIHGDKYDYSLVNYVNNKTKVNIVCPIHGEFSKNPSHHLKGSGCPECSKIKKSKSLEQFIEESINIHGNKYDYSLVNYKNSSSLVTIICPIHGKFKQRSSSHLEGKGCLKCKRDSDIKSLDQFINESNLVHNNRYDYSLVNYINTKVKVKIICDKHGVFEQMPYKHLQNRGCPKCKRSKGELKISNWLDNNGIYYIEQKEFKDLNYKGNLKCDFYLPSYNLVIEYNGIQHYEVVEHFGGIDGFNDRKIRDDIKNEYLMTNKINLLVIKYTDYNNIDDILNDLLT